MDSFAAKGTQDRRDILLKGVTVGVLLLSTGAAWLFVLARSSATHRGQSEMEEHGAEIIALIRKDGLGRYWSDEQSVDWYLCKDGRQIGWRVSVRRRGAGGSHEGLRLISYGRSKHWEHWVIDEKGREGRYIAGDLRVVRGSPHARWHPTVTITLSNGRVKMQQPGNVRSEAPAPENYVPEGMLELACYVAGRRDAKAQFALIFNGDKPDGGVTQFGHVKLTRIERGDQATLVTLERSFASGDSKPGRMLFDDGGRLIEQTIGVNKDRLVSPVRIAGQFNDAFWYLNDLLRHVGMSNRGGPVGTRPASAATRPTTRRTGQGKRAPPGDNNRTAKPE